MNAPKVGDRIRVTTYAPLDMGGKRRLPRWALAEYCTVREVTTDPTKVFRLTQDAERIRSVKPDEWWVRLDPPARAPETRFPQDSWVHKAFIGGRVPPSEEGYL